MKMDKYQFNSKDYVHRLKADETGGYVASILEFPGCIAEGDTAQEAIDNLNKAAESWISAAESTGYPVREPIDFNGFSGKTALRMPRNLHKQAAELADLEGCSLNQLLVTAIAQYVGGKQSSATLKVSHIYYTQHNTANFIQFPETAIATGNILCTYTSMNNKKFVANTPAIGIIRGQ
jgi:predicted RNase H-like HicB family nuclease